jgi:kanosamine-6-phosphate phosphatase
MHPLGDRRMHLPRVDAPRWLVFSDFDETYLAHDGSPERRRDRRALEQLLIEYAKPLGIIFGWVTDGPIDSVAATFQAHGLRIVPHFIASSWGAELDFFSREEGRRSAAEWDARMGVSGFSLALVAEARDELANHGVKLEDRKEGGPRMDSFVFVPPAKQRASELAALVRRVAEKHFVDVHVGPCHPAFGEAEGAYGVDFVPRGANKRNVIQFVTERVGVSSVRTMAFGDDVGDIEMLSAVEHGYLVDNATDEARRRFSRTAGSSYARGILDMMERRITGSRSA